MHQLKVKVSESEPKPDSNQTSVHVSFYFLTHFISSSVDVPQRVKRAQNRERGPPSAPAENLINIMYDEVALNFEQACMFK